MDATAELTWCRVTVSLARAPGEPALRAGDIVLVNLARPEMRLLLEKKVLVPQPPPEQAAGEDGEDASPRAQEPAGDDATPEPVLPAAPEPAAVTEAVSASGGELGEDTASTAELGTDEPGR